MKFVASTVALAALAIAAPAPAPEAAALTKRADIDGTIFNYALTLEHLEAAFYRQGLAKFSQQELTAAGFNSANFYKNIRQVGRDEQTHVKVLTAALKAAGVKPVAACTYDFGNLTPESFIRTAALLEGVGVTAYLGAAALITNNNYLTEAASILTVEARHSAWLRTELNQAPIPQQFDTALDFNQVYSLAAPFIVRCPAGNPTLPVQRFPTLAVTKPNAIYGKGSQIVLNIGRRAKQTGNMFCAFPLVTGNIFVKAFRTGPYQVRCVAPKGEFGPQGQSYVVLVSGTGTLADANTIAGPAVVNIQAAFLGGN